MSHRRRHVPHAVRAVLLIAICCLVLSPFWPQMPVQAQTPSLVLLPSSAPPDTVISAQGVGFPPTSDGQLLWADGSLLNTFTTDPLGGFISDFIVPAVDPGSYVLSAVVGSGDTVVRADAAFTVEPASPPSPTPEPTPTPSPEPTATPTPEPTATPSPEPTATPTSAATATPSPEPTPTSEPTPTPISGPTATSTPAPTPAPTPAAAAEPLTFAPVADAYVAQANPTTNYGTAPTLLVDNSPVLHTYLRFDVSGVSGPIQSATLRLWVIDPATNGPPVSTSPDTTWTESGLTWDTKPAVANPTGDVGAVPENAWLEYDVTSLVAGDGSYTFALIPQSSNGLDVSSREAATNQPQLVVTTGSGEVAPTPTPSPTPEPTAASTPESTATPTPTPEPPTPTPTPTSEETIEVLAAADARVREAFPTTNYGTSSVLQADGGSDPDVESYLKFSVTGLSGAPGSATVRLFVGTGTYAGSNDGPALYTAPSTWQEGTITWEMRPARGTAALGDLGAVSAGTWVEYDVSSVIVGNGDYTFVLATTSADATDVDSREATNKPVLVLGGTSSETTPTPTSAPEPTAAPTPTPAAAATLTFAPVADAHVAEANPTTNYGAATTLLIDTSPVLHTYVRFEVSGVSEPIQSATLRFWVTDSASNGPPVYTAADTTWAENSITWNTKPAVANATDDKASVSASTWLEYNVTSRVSGNGTYTFALVPQSSNGLDVNSREAGSNGPQLVVMTGSGEVTPTPTPTSGTSSGVIVAAGDIAVCGDSHNDEATAKLLDGISGATVLALGDNAYNSGTLTDFNTCYDPTWGRHKARTRPVPGNHDYAGSSNGKGYYDYFNGVGVFSGPAGDRDKGYYSFNVDAWHVVAINSCAVKIDKPDDGTTSLVCDPGTAQLDWLRADLAAHPTACTLAYWHHPHFSSGHDKHNGGMMTGVFQTLYDAGADVVLVGHSHDYERFAPQRPDGTLDTTFGIREFVIGTGGAAFTGSSTRAPNSEVFNNKTYGVVKLTLRSNGYDWQFIPIAGQSFTDSGSDPCHGAPSAAVDVPGGTALLSIGARLLPSVLVGMAGIEAGLLILMLWRRTKRAGRRRARRRKIARRASSLTGATFTAPYTIEVTAADGTATGTEHGTATGTRIRGESPLPTGTPRAPLGDGPSH